MCFCFSPVQFFPGNQRDETCALCQTFQQTYSDAALDTLNSAFFATKELEEMDGIQGKFIFRTRMLFSSDNETMSRIEYVLAAVNINFECGNVWMIDGKKKDWLSGARFWLQQKVHGMVNLRTFVVERKGAEGAFDPLAAVCSVRPVRLANGVKYLEIALAATLPRYQGMGLMKWVLGAVLTQFANVGAEYIRVQSCRSPATVAFYKKLGFREVSALNSESFQSFLSFKYSEVIHMEASYKIIHSNCF